MPTLTDAVWDVRFRNNGKCLAAAADSTKSVHVWKVANWTMVDILKCATDAFYSVAFSADNSVRASGALRGNVYLWITLDWTATTRLKHGTKVYGLAFTPDGTHLASGYADNSISLM